MPASLTRGMFACLVLLPSSQLAVSHGPDLAHVDVYGDELPPHAVARLGTERLSQTSPYFLEISPDDKTVAALALGEPLRLWDVVTGKLLWSATVTSPGKSGVPAGWTSLAWSADGKRIAAGCQDKSVRFLDAATGKEVRKVAGLPVYPTFLALEPTGRFVAVGHRRASVSVWDLKQDKEVAGWGKVPSVDGLMWTADGKRLIAVSADPASRDRRLVTVWDDAGRQEKQHTLERKDQHPGWLSPDGKWFVFLSPDYKTYELIDPLTGKVGLTIDVKGRQIMPSFSRNGRFLTAPCELDGLARVWEVETGKLLHQFKASPVRLDRAAVSSDGKRLVTFAAGSRSLIVWDTADAKPLHDFTRHQGGISHVVFAPDGKSVYTVGGENRQSVSLTAELAQWSVREWDVASGKHLRVFTQESKRELRFLLFSADGKRLAVATNEGQLSAWEIKKGNRSVGELPTEATEYHIGKEVIRAPILSFERPVFNGDNRVVLGGSRTGVQRWDVVTAKLLPPLKYPETTAYLYGIPSSDPQTVVACVTVGFKGELAHLDAATGDLKQRLPIAAPTLMGVATSPDGRTAAAANRGKVHLYEWASGELRRVVDTGEPACSVVAFSHDGWLLFTASDSNPNGESTIRVWRAMTGELVRELKGGHHKRVNAFALSPDGTRLVSCSGESQALIWDLSGLPAPAKAASLAKEEADALWAALRGNGESAYRGVRRLAETDAPAVELLRQKTRTLKIADEKQMLKLLTDLDSEDFETREQADMALEKLGELARDGLRRALSGSASAEVRRRALGLLEKLDKNEKTPQASAELTWLRVVEALEANGSPPARAWLRELAKEGPSPSLTVEAKTALERGAKLEKK